MSTNSKGVTLLVLGVLSLVLSRGVFFFINDPEGPNLVVVLGLAAIIFGVLWAVRFLFTSAKAR